MRTDVILLGLASLLANASAGEGGLSQHKPFLRKARMGDTRGRSLQSATTQTCSNGIEGIESANGGVCCPTVCGLCGGEACTEAAVNAGLDDGDCCFSDIILFGASCSENQMAPCIVDDASKEAAGDTCSNTDGVEGISSANGDVCCPSECGLCGGRDCTEAALTAGLDDGDCCVSDITNEGVKCSDSGAAPCIAYDSEDESGSTPVQESSTPMYITLGCGKIGDYEDPFTVSSTVSDLTVEACYELCASESSLYFALVEGNVCSCGDEETFVQTFLDSYEEETAGTCNTACSGSPDETCGGAQAFDLYRILPTCTGGIVGVEAASGDVCCPFSCGECGGDKCVGEGGCCEHTIQSREGLCEDTNAAPCVFNVVAPPPTPVPAPTTPMPTRPPGPVSTCTGDIPGLESDDGTVCCMEHCASCRIESADECVGVPACCQEKILLTGLMCSDEGVEEGPCILM
ncbi:unnamed protein product [Ectocarpus sp. 12 AP-2014]